VRVRKSAEDFSRATNISLVFGNLRISRSEDMAFDLSMPILVVDDYNTMIRIIRNLLKQIGFENVDDASDGSAALAKMQGKKYGLVISDWNMEPMTGYDLLREVRASPELSQTPFIMITAESKTENVIAAKKAGVSNYIVQAVQRRDAEDEDGSGVSGVGRVAYCERRRAPFQWCATERPASATTMSGHVRHRRMRQRIRIRSRSFSEWKQSRAAFLRAQYLYGTQNLRRG
jgi:two-component system, chemotaxis family, chemotaxis protein CheY